MRSTDGNNIITIPLNVGMNQSMGERLAPAENLYEVRNMRSDARGGLRKRIGSRGFFHDREDSNNVFFNASDACDITPTPAFLAKSGGQAFAGNSEGWVFGVDLASCDPSPNFAMVGRVSTTKPVRRRTIFGRISDNYITSPTAIAVTSRGYRLIVSSAIGMVVESPAGDRLLTSYSPGGATFTKPRCFAIGSVFYLVYQDVTSIVLRTIESESGDPVTVSDAVTIATLNASDDFWDVTRNDARPDTDRSWWLVYQSGSAALSVAKADHDAVSLTSSSISVTGQCPCSIFDYYDGDGNVWVGWYDDVASTGDVRFAVYGSSLAVVKAADTIESAALVFGPPLFGEYRRPGADAEDTDRVFSIHRQGDASTPLDVDRASRVCVHSNTTTDSSPQSIGSLLPISKPDRGGRVWCLVEFGTADRYFTRAVMVRLSRGSTLAKHDCNIELATPLWESFGELSLGIETGNYFSEVAVGPESTFFAIARVLQTVSGDQMVVCDVYEYQTSDQHPHLDTVELGQTVATAGQPHEFATGPTPTRLNATTEVTTYQDVGGSAEIGFIHAAVLTDVLAGGTGGSMTPGTYQITAIYDDTDVFGRRHRSAPCPPISADVAADQVLAFRFLTPTTQRIVMPASDLRVSVYRNVLGGDAFQLARQVPQIFNVVGAGSSMSDSDDTIAANEFLYTEGGVIANDLAPACRFVTRSEDRLWCGGLWDPNVIECSKVMVPGEPPQFTGNAAFQVILPEPCTGIAYLDGNVIAFSEDDVYLIGGDGPNDQGVGAFGAPRAIGFGVGCVNYISVVETPAGVLFQSRLGYYMIPRGLGTPQYVGAAVQDEVDSTSAKCLSSAVLQTRDGHLARFLTTTADGTTGTRVLSYDLVNGNWYVDEYPEAEGPPDGLGGRYEIGAWPDGFALAGWLGNFSENDRSAIWYEDDERYVDDESSFEGKYVGQRFKTAWIQPFGPCGQGRVNKVLIACEPIGSEQSLTIAVSTDHTDGIAAQSYTWDVSDASPIAYREIALEHPNCTAVQIEVTESASGEALDVAGFRFVALALETSAPTGVRLTSAEEREA